MDRKRTGSLLDYYRRVWRALESLDPQKQPRAVCSPGSEIPRGRIIVFPGSFNPPTLAHLALLKQAHYFARRQRGHWQIYAAISKQIVDKEVVQRMTLLDRVVLLRDVLRDERRKVGVLLLNRGLYVEQAQGIHATFPEVRRVFFLMGYDKIVQILDPHYYSDRDAALRELFGLADLLVAPRGADSEKELRILLDQAENKPFARFVHPLPLAPEYQSISSTQIRQTQRPPAGLLPARVEDFIERTQPYAAPVSKSDGTLSDPYAERVQTIQRMFSE